MKILHIDSSILGDHSVSRKLTASIVAREKALHPDATVVHHDFGANPLRYLSGGHLAAFQGAIVDDASLTADLVQGSGHIDEVFEADVIVIGAPMYNFAIPAQLKSWIDRIVVAGKTFRYGANGPEGLVPSGKKVFIGSARGGIYSAGSPAAGLDHQESYLKAVLGFIGLTDVTFIRAEGLSKGEDARASALDQAEAAIGALSA